jgi:hypothetical protein
MLMLGAWAKFGARCSVLVLGKIEELSARFFKVLEH